MSLRIFDVSGPAAGSLAKNLYPFGLMLSLVFGDLSKFLRYIGLMHYGFWGKKKRKNTMVLSCVNEAVAHLDQSPGEYVWDPV